MQTRSSSKQSPLKGKARSPGLPDQLRKLLAIDIQKAGGPFEFDQGEKPGLAIILKREHYQPHLNNIKKKSISNLVDSWKNKLYYKNTEDWLEKLYLPLVLNGESPATPTSDTLGYSDQEEEEYIPEPDPAPSSQIPTTKPAQTRPKTKKKPSPKMSHPKQQGNKIGHRIVVPLSRGLILVIYWVDSKLDNMDVRISEDGLSVFYKTKMIHPKNASELLCHYPWGSDATNMAVGALDTLLESDELNPASDSSEWSDPEVIVSLDEPVLRTFVDIAGNKTGHIGYRSDDAGRQTITFILKTESSAKVVPSAGVFMNSSSGTTNEDMYEEETVADSKVASLEAKLAQQAAQMSQQTDQMNQLNSMMMKFMEMQMAKRKAKALQPKPDPAQSSALPAPTSKRAKKAPAVSEAKPAPVKSNTPPMAAPKPKQTTSTSLVPPAPVPAVPAPVPSAPAVPVPAQAPSSLVAPVAKPVKNKDGIAKTTEQERKQSFKPVGSSKKTREDTLGVRSRKKKEEKLARLRAAGAVKLPCIEIPTHAALPDSPIASPVSSEPQVFNSSDQFVAEAEADMKATISEGAEILVGMQSGSLRK